MNEDDPVGGAALLLITFKPELTRAAKIAKRILPSQISTDAGDCGKPRQTARYESRSRPQPVESKGRALAHNGKRRIDMWWSTKPEPLANDDGVLFQQLLRRKHWKRFPSELIQQIFSNSHSVFDKGKEAGQALRAFVFIAEYNKLLKAKLLPIAQRNAPEALSEFSVVLYHLGSSCTQAIPSAPNKETLFKNADMSFMSAVLCNRYNLAAYIGMAVLWGNLAHNKQMGLTWCGRYRNAERLLRSAPDHSLDRIQRAERELLDRAVSRRVAKEMATALHTADEVPPDGGEIVDDLERAISAL